MDNDTAVIDPPADLDSDAIMKIAQDADAAEPSTDSTPSTQDNGTPAAPATDDQAKQPDASKQTTPKAGEQAKTPSEPQETKFAKAQKEAERRDRSWQALEREKTEFRSEKQQLTERLNSLQRELETLRQRPTGPAKDEHGATADDYDSLAKRYRDEGNDDLAKAAQARAERLRTQSNGRAAPAQDPFATPEFQAEWQRQTQQLIQAEPDLNNPDNPIVRATNTLLADPTYGRFFKSSPDGIKAAVEVAKLMRASAGAQELNQKLTAAQEEIKTKSAEIARLNSLLQPRGSHPAAPNGAKDPDNLTDADVLAIARAADRGET